MMSFLPLYQLPNGDYVDPVSITDIILIKPDVDQSFSEQSESTYIVRVLTAANKHGHNIRHNVYEYGEKQSSSLAFFLESYDYKKDAYARAYAAAKETRNLIVADINAARERGYSKLN